MKKIIALLLTLTMVLSLAACGSKTSTDGGSDSIAPSEKPSTDSVVKTPLGDFSAQDFEGNTITKDIFADYDLTMVNLWTTTCGYCIEEMPALNELRKELQAEGKSFNIKPGYVTTAFPLLLEHNGLRKIRYHDLRHSCASLLLANGVPMKQI